MVRCFIAGPPGASPFARQFPKRAAYSRDRLTDCICMPLPRRSTRLFLLPSLCLFLLAGVAAAAGATRMVHANGWAVTAPNGWNAFQGEHALGADFRMFAPRDLDAACAFYSRSGLGLGMTNDQIRSALGASTMLENAIADFLQADELFPGELSDIEVFKVAPQVEHPSGWPFQRASFTYFDGGTQASGGKPSVGWAAITFKNDAVYVAYCGANNSSVEASKKAISVILNTIEMAR